MKNRCHPELAKGRTFFILDWKMVFDRLRLTGNFVSMKWAGEGIRLPHRLKKPLAMTTIKTIITNDIIIEYQKEE